jgi:hypothetical protein
MSTAEDPTGAAREQTATTAIQSAAGAAPEAPIPLSPLHPPAPGPGLPPRSVPALDNALTLVVVLLAFLVALFPAYNGEFFLHAAAGRLIAEGRFPFGADPFTSTTAGERWVNHSWLFDLFVFENYRFGDFGGSVLVVLKALLVAFTALLMLGAARRPGASAWVPACCVGLAVLALSPRVFLQPVILSYVLLALTLALLLRPGPRGRVVWLLPPLFALWVNLDAWFFLGPLTVGLYLLGEVLQEHFGPARPEADRPAPGALRRLALVLLVGLAACLLNPYHVYAFRLPPHMLPASAGPALSQDAEFRRLYLLPFESAYFKSNLGLSAAGVAYFPLLLLGLASFALTAGAVRWGRVLVWLVFAVLSGLHVRAIPFFAVVAGPITALNFLDFAAARWGAAPRFEGGWRGWAVAGRALSLIVAVVLLVAAVPGWLQAQPYRYRRVGWVVHVDPSLKEAALQFQKWREQGVVGKDDVLFHVSSDVASYLAWFCPGQRGFIDHRVPLFAAAGEDFVKARKALSGEDRLEEPAGAEWDRPESPGWRDVFRRRGVRWLVFHTPDAYVARSTLAQLLSNPEEFPVCYYQGRTAIFGWRDVERDKKAPDPYKDLRVNFGRLAFGPGAQPAPPQGAGREPESYEWWMGLWKAPPGHDEGSDSAVLHSTRFDTHSQFWIKRNVRNWESLFFADAVGLAVLPGGALPNGALLPFRMLYAYTPPPDGKPGPFTILDQIAHRLAEGYVRSEDTGPPSALYLAVRAARRSLAANPDDGRTWLVLGEAYYNLANRTREGARGRLLPHVPMVRQTQIAAAFHRALNLKLTPGEQQYAHRRLVNLYQEQKFIEPAARHYRKYLVAFQEAGPPPGQEKPFNEEVERMEKEAKRREREVKTSLDQYEVQAANKPVLQKVYVAMQYGLADKALDLLLNADPKDLQESRAGAPMMTGAMLEINLLMSLGRAAEVRDVFSTIKPESEGAFGTNRVVGLPAIGWARVQLAAVDGDYEAADKHLAELLDFVASAASAQLGMIGMYQPRAGAPPLSKDEMFALGAGQLLLEQTAATRGIWETWRLPPAFAKLGATNGIALGLLEQETALHTIRGWLALEAGRVDDARRELEAALEVGRVPSGKAGMAVQHYVRSTPLAATLLELLRENAK